MGLDFRIAGTDEQHLPAASKTTHRSCCGARGRLLPVLIAFLFPAFVFLILDQHTTLRSMDTLSWWTHALQSSVIESRKAEEMFRFNEDETWGVCECAPAGMGCVLVLGGCVVRTINGVAVIAARDRSATAKLSYVVFHCRTTVASRLATPSERVRMLGDCFGGGAEDAAGGDVIAVMGSKWYGNHAFHGVMGPTGALQKYATLATARVLFDRLGIPSPPTRAVDWAVGSSAFDSGPIQQTKVSEFALSVGKTLGRLIVDPLSKTACTGFHTIGYIMKDGLVAYPNDGMTAVIHPERTVMFNAFREHVRSLALAEIVSPTTSLGLSTDSILYAERRVACDGNMRARFVPTTHVNQFSDVFVNASGIPTVTKRSFAGPPSSFSDALVSVRGSRIAFACEGAFFTWMLFSHPDTIWVMYYRSKPSRYRSYSFFTPAIRVLLDLKVVIYVVTNGVAPPMNGLARAVSEPFTPGAEVRGSGRNGQPSPH